MDDNPKSYIHNPKPQIQSMEPTKRRSGTRTIPYVFGEKRRINKLLCVFWIFFFFFWVFVREKKRRETLGRRENFKKMCVL